MATPTNLPSAFTDNTGLPAATLNDLRGAFRVLQVVAATTTTTATNATTTFADVGLSASITPQASSSKILVMTTNAVAKTGANAANAVFLRLLRDSTSIATYNFGLATLTALIVVGDANITIFDSPATTAAVTYKIQMKNNVASAGVEFAANNSPCTIVLMEISA